MPSELDTDLVAFLIPIVVFHLEDGNWVDFPVAKLIMWPVLFANIITITALAHSPTLDHSAKDKA